MTMLTQLPFHKDKNFQQLNFFVQMLIVSIVYIAECVECLDKVWYQISVVQCNKNHNTNKSKQEKLSKVFKDANL